MQHRATISRNDIATCYKAIDTFLFFLQHRDGIFISPSIALSMETEAKRLGVQAKTILEQLDKATRDNPECFGRIEYLDTVCRECDVARRCSLQTQSIAQAEGRPIPKADLSVLQVSKDLLGNVYEVKRGQQANSLEVNGLQLTEQAITSLQDILAIIREPLPETKEKSHDSV